MNRLFAGCIPFLLAVAALPAWASQTRTADGATGNTEILLSDSAWKLKSFPMDSGEEQKAYAPGFDESGFKAVSVPAEIQLSTGLTGMELYRQRKEISLINKSEWWYRKSFTGPKLQNGERVRLVFDRSDYFTSVWLNGEKLGDHEGAYTSFSFDVTSKIKQGGTNVLAVKVTSPWLPKGRSLIEYNKSSFTLSAPDWNSQGISHYPYVMSFQWNGVPASGNAAMTIGLTGDVKLVTVPERSIDDLYVYTKSLNPDGSATLAISGTVRNDGSGDAQGSVNLKLRPENFTGDAEQLPRQELTLKPGTNDFSLEFTVKNPKLWWTWDQGPQNLYKLTATLDAPGQAAHSKAVTVGIRTFTREPGMSYWLNGRHFFLKGVWYPMQSFYSSTDTRAAYRTGLILLRAANANFMVNQVIEKASFYDLCDELGLLVFTQMPFNQVGPYQVLEPDNPRRDIFLKTAMEFGADILRENRNHPSIGMWSPLAESRVAAQAQKGYYEPLYEGMREVVEKLSPGTIYQTSYCDDGEDHIWTATAGYFEYGDYRNHYDFAPAFVSEYGSQAMSSYENLHKWIPLDDVWSEKNPRKPGWFNLPMNITENAYPASTMIQDFHSLLNWPLKMVDTDPRSAKDMVEASQLYQAFVMRYASDAFRRKKYNPIQGTRWWAYRDPAPGYQWGFLDHDSVPKMAYYSFKKSMAPLAVSLAFKNELEGLPNGDSQSGSSNVHIPVVVVNDHLTEVPLEVKTEVLDLKGNVVYSQTNKATVGADSTKTVDVLNWTVPGVPATEVYALRATVQQQNGDQHAESRIYLKVKSYANQMPKLDKKVRVLLISTHRYGGALANDLRDVGVDLDVIDQEQLDRLGELRNAVELEKKYDVIWLGSFEALWKVLDDDMAEGVAQAVKDGVGFVHTGSESSFHGGDTMASCLDFTKLADVLPVKVREAHDDIDLLNTSKDLRVFASGWTDAGLKQMGVASFNEVETKPGSDVVMKFMDWPLLVTGLYGKGHTVAFMGYTPYDNKSDEATWRALYSQMLLAATGENPQYRYAWVMGNEKPVFQLLKEQPEASVKATPAAIASTAKNGTASFKVEVANGGSFARLLRMRIEWNDAMSHEPIVMYGDNYFDLFPHESKEVAVDVAMPEGFTGTARGTLILEGTNVPESRIPVSLSATGQ
ncbi:MAG: glutamine amidotransferase [Acidobacteriaceae bacterium]|nr:glutamine amidotransferase [Acidobacteriaceae bacterium]